MVICTLDSPKKLRKIVLSTCLFKLPGGGYKSFQKYLSGIKIMNDTANKRDASVVVFIDMSISKDQKIMKYLRSLNRVVTSSFMCRQLLVDKHHIGTIGMLIRFFPLFDYDPIFSDKHVFVLDADIVQYRIDMMFEMYDNILNYHLEDTNYIGYIGRYNHINMIRSKSYNGKYYPYCLAQKIIGFKRLPHIILETFINKLIKYKNPNKFERLTDYEISDEKKCEQNICFGVDEYFLNKVLIPYMALNKLDFCYRISFSPIQLYFFTYDKWKRERLVKRLKKIKTNVKKIDKIINKKSWMDEIINKDNLEFLKDAAKKIITVAKELKEEKNYSIIPKYNLYNMFTSEYKKYFYYTYIRSIGRTDSDTILNYVAY